MSVKAGWGVGGGVESLPAQSFSFSSLLDAVSLGVLMWHAPGMHATTLSKSTQILYYQINLPVTCDVLSTAEPTLASGLHTELNQMKVGVASVLTD